MDRGGGYRKQWQKGSVNPPKIADNYASQTPKGTYEGPDKYDEYLIQLQYKNRLLKQLKAKDDKQIALERKEQGFSLYVNGANTRLGAVGAAGGAGAVKYSPRRPTTKKPKTAGDYPRRALIGQLDMEDDNEYANRAKTAPGKVQRKNWTQVSVDIKTEQGERLKSRLAQAPEYSEDFELYDSLAAQAEDGEIEGKDEEKEAVEEEEEEERSQSEDEDQEDYFQLTRQMTVILEKGSDGDSDLEIDASQYKKSPQKMKRRTKHGRVEEKEEEEDDEDVDSDEDDSATNQQLLLSIEDVKTLRRSLEANPHIRRNICRKGTASDDESSSSEDDIPEEDEEEIEEDIDVADDGLIAGGNSGGGGEKMKIEPGDMIVLDFASYAKPAARELISAKRKDDADEVEFPRRPSQDSSRQPNSKKPKEVVLDAGPITRKSTQLKAQKKSEELPKQWVSGSNSDISAIQRAMAEENRVASATRVQSGARSAPSEQTKVSSPMPAEETKRPSTVILQHGDQHEEEEGKGDEQDQDASHHHKEAPGDHNVISEVRGHDPLLTSQNLDDLKLAMALEKVKDMDAKSQRRLLKVLGQLEETTSPRSSRTTPRSSRGAGQQSAERGGARDSDLFTGPKLAPRSKSATGSKSVSLESSAEEVIIEVNSNWGHPSRVGVTEVQFFDPEGQRLTIQPKCVDMHNAQDCKGELASIVNGKMKTTRERNMWSCEYEKSSPVLLLFRLPASVAEAGIAKLKVWNFNKNLKDLSMGIKEARILLGGKVVWEGIVDKGCGNQVFDYSMTIPLPNKPPRADQTDTTATPSEKVGAPTSLPHAKSEITSKGAQTHRTKDQNVEERLHPSGDVKHSAPGDSLEERLFGENGNPNKSNSNSNGVEEGDEDGQSGELRLSIAFEIDLDLFPTRAKPVRCGNSPQKKKGAGFAKKMTETETRMSEGGQVQDARGSGSVSQKSESNKCAQGASISITHPAPSVSAGSFQMDASLSTSIDVAVPGVSAGLSVASDSLNPEDPRQTIGCETRVLMRSADTTLDLPVVDDAIQIYATPRSSFDLNREKTPVADDITPRAAPMETHVSPIKAQRESERDQSFETDEPCMLDQLKELSIQRPPNKRPQWLKEEKQTKRVAAKIKQKKPPWLGVLDDETSLQNEAEDSLDITSPWPGSGRRPSDDRRSVAEKIHHDAEADGSGATKEAGGRRSRNQNPKQLSIAATMADDMEELRWRQKAVEGGMSDEDHLSPPGHRLPGHSGQRHLLAARSNQDRSLEESWTSLHMFDKSQKGRLAPNVNLDLEGDALDSVLTGRRSKVQEEPNDDSSDEFEIPLLPTGRCLTLNIKTTWGDRHYVGLNGIEIFQSNGEHVQIKKITAEPSDLNVLPEHTNDPRVVTNLINGVNCTRDDVHMWLAPFTPGRMHLITVTFDHPVRVAMIRIWNYNKSRIHSFRGAKDVEVSLDDQYIFKGEIARASGALQGDPSSFGDTILFTEDEDILELVSRNDEVFVAAEDWFSSSLDEDAAPPTRPRTADVGEERPMTTARQNRARHAKSEPAVGGGVGEGAAVPPSALHPRSQEGGSHFMAPHTRQDWGAPQQDPVFTGRVVKLNFTMTWGDPHYLGVTGMEVMDVDGEAIPLSMTMLDACPRDLNDLPEYEMDDRTLDKLLDGVNVTSSDEHMWMIPFAEGCDHFLTVDFGRDVQMTGLRIWNYNKSPEDTYRGARVVHVWLDEQQVSPGEGFLIRKGPGNCFFDFAQDISFVSQQTSWAADSRGQQRAIQDNLRQSQVAFEIPSQEYIPMHMPRGFVFQFQLLTTYGDLYYVGLNGLEFYDAQGQKMQLTESNIAAFPPSVNVLEGVADDTRTPDKLIDGVNDTMDGGHMWLAPILPSVINRVYVIFDEPVTVSMIKLWNYSKTPQRGVKEFGLLVDDLLVYQGILGQVTSAARGILPGVDMPTPYHTILFADNEDLRRRERHTILQNQQQEQDVQMTDDHQVMAHFKNPKKAANKTVDQALRPKTSVPGQGATRRR